MFQAAVDEHRHSCGHTDSVVGTERGAAGLHPVAVDIGFNRILEEIVFNVVVLLGHHVHMGLKYHRRRIFMTRRGGFGHHHIAHLIGTHGYGVFLCEIEEKRTNLFFMTGGTRNFRDRVEAFPDELRLKVFYFH